MDSEKKSLLAWVALATVIVVAAVLHMQSDYRDSLLRDKYLAEDFCPSEIADLQSHTVFLLDFSDSIKEEMVSEKIKEQVISHREGLPDGGKLSALFINADSYDEIYAVCKLTLPRTQNPNWKCGDPLYGIDAAKEAEAKRYCNFAEQMQKLVEDVVDRSKGEFPSSPLIEVVADVSMKPDFQSVEKREIILFSDLLQNTNEYSFYPDRGPAPNAKSVFAKESIDLAGTEIVVYQIPRKSHRTRQEKAKTFWKDLFNLAGVEVPFRSIE
ncbi:MAG: hypothetical protein MPK09_02105 [Gammaproteobacteria bacterium]|nr:hypothetical protein [Gammaproteobacteria bacterium]